MPHLREILIGSMRVRRPSLHHREAIITGLLATGLTATAIAAGQDSWALPLVLGATFTGILNLTGAPDQRARAMSWTLGWLTLVTLLGGLVSMWRWEELLVVAIVGLVGGYAGALGPRAALIGVLAMVVFTVFAGMDTDPADAVQYAVLVAVGGLIHLVISMAPTLLRAPRALLDRTEDPGPLLHRMDPRQRIDDLFLHHAVRLAVALVAGSAIAHATSWPHPYWIPMTIVWMSKPDRDGTVTRVVERILGTLLGVAVSIALINGISDDDLAISLYAGIGVFLLLAFLFANYPIAVSGVTLMVVTLLSLQGEPVLETAPFRIAATLVAGVITLAAALTMWRRMPGPT